MCSPDAMHWRRSRPLTRCSRDNGQRERCMTTTVPSVNAKRRRRIERELRALHAMQNHMNTRDIVLSLLAIPLLALLCFLVGAKLHIAFGHLWVSILAAFAFGG